MKWITILLSVCLLPLSVLAMQPQEEPLSIARISGEVTFDGFVNEPAWDAITSLPLTTYEPVAGLSPSERTEIRIGYDDDFIYASIRAFDSDPSGIRINSLYRNRLSGDDVFHILLDTYNDNESAIGFTITPSGAKRDALVSNDGEGARAMNADFSTYWDVATQVNGEGWFAEVRIPFSSIGFQDHNGRVVMGLFVQRGISRKNERITFPEVPSNIARAYFKPSLAKRIVFEDIYSSRPLHITPYLFGGAEKNYTLNETGTGYSGAADQTFEAGVDIKYGITNNLTFDLTVNTDFAQVEADEQQINLTRFNLFFPEKRQFFQERSGIFEFQTGTNGRLFNSRRIGLTDTGEPVRILTGGRLTGRVGSWDVGVLNMQTGSYQEIESENFGVIRLRRGIINSYSHAGAMATSRVDADGVYNLALGVDGSIRVGNNDYVSFVWAHSIEDEAPDHTLLSASNILLNFENRSRQGFAYQSTLSLSGEEYNPGTGFVARRNYYNLSQLLKYGWIPDGDSPLLWHSIQANGNIYWQRTTNELESIEVGPEWLATTKPGGQINAGLTWYHENIPIPFTLLGKAEIAPGEYNFLRAVAGYQMPGSRLLRTKAELDAGSFYGGWRITATLAPTWNISKHLELETSYLFHLVDVENRDDWFEVHVGQLRIRTALNTRLSTNAFVQFNSSADIISSNVRFRYNFRDGNDFWIVYNEGMNTRRDRFDPVLPLTNTRTLLIKYTHTFHK